MVPGAKGNMGSLEFRINLYHLAVQVLEFGVPGDFAEIGCNAGESSVVLQKILQDLDPTRKLHVYDSFQGVPKSDDAKDEGAYNEGDMTASQEELRENFRRMGLPQPEVHPGWFEDTLAPTLPQRLAFCLIDGDLFSSTTTALAEAYQRLSPGGICVLGVYCDTRVFAPRSTSPKYRSPGVKRACDQFLEGKPERMSVLFSGDYTSGYFRKR
jgi:O-methyltransferase